MPDADGHLGGSTWAGSVLFGVQVSPRLAVELEPSYAGEFRDEYTYRPGPSRIARVVSTRRDTFFTFQLRWKIGALEPVAGVSYVRDRTRRLATYVPGGSTYFDDRHSGGVLGVATGLDASLRLAPHVFLVPTFRLVVRPGSGAATDTTRAGPFVFRYGAGARVTF